MANSLRQSSLKAWETCRAQYFAQYVLGLALGTGEPNLDFGTNFHKQVENYHNGLPYDEALIAPYAALYGPDDATRVEIPFDWTPGRPHSGNNHSALERLPWKFTGTIDRFWNGHGLYDLKTSRVSWSQRKADEDIQATAYCYYWWQVRGKLVPFTFTIYRKDWTPRSRFSQMQVITTERTVEDFDRFWLYCFKVIQDITQEQHWDCTCRNQAHAAFSQRIYA